MHGSTLIGVDRVHTLLFCSSVGLLLGSFLLFPLLFLKFIIHRVSCASMVTSLRSDYPNYIYLRFPLMELLESGTCTWVYKLLAWLCYSIQVYFRRTISDDISVVSLP